MKILPNYRSPGKKHIHIETFEFSPLPPPKKKQNRTLWECVFFNVFKLAKVKIEEPHISVSAVHPSLAMHISLFCLLQGNQKDQKTKNGESMSDSRILQKPWKTKKKKKKGRTYVYPKPPKTKKTKKKQKGQNLCKTKKTKKKQNGRTYVPVSGMGSAILFFLFFFWFFEVKPKKQKNTKWQSLCPSVWHGVSTFVFFCFFCFFGFSW